MNKEQFIEKTNFLFDGSSSGVGLSMYIVLKTADGFVAKQADIDEQSVEPKLREQFLNFINAEIRDNAELNINDLATADNRKNTIYSYNFDEVPQGLEVMGELIRDEDREVFNFDDDDFNSIYGFVFLIGSETKKIALYKKHYPINFIKRDSNFFVFKSNTRLVEAEEEIIRINETFEFLQVEDEIVILNLRTLEQYFGFETVIKNKAASNIAIIQNSKLLESTEWLQELAGDVRYAKKLMKIKSDSAVFDLDFTTVRDFIRHHPKLKKRIRFNFDGTRIDLDTKASVGLFLQILDDEFLKSELTNLLYETDTKNLFKASDTDS